ncbi:ABC transporter permease subunit [Streptomyces sp. SID14478]|uniref:ABC transporter permease n=1 Tax=Streptomyces sp. SID14478 TaxID=2706073 RepID=UPI0013D946C7|nr:ABC transporter permease [Streptomyces sp. SID14478]NEB75236.1 ABC transporter permease subunit [Streptomyces sp. SID14478]
MNTAPTTAYASAAGHYGFRQAARMEWIKLRSLRSTTYALLLTVVAMIAMGVVTMANTKAPHGASKVASFDPTNNVLAGVALGQLVVGVLGVLLVTGEYSSGTIRATLAAVPDRRLALTAKAAVFGGAALLVGEVVALVTFVAGVAALSPDVPHPSLGDPAVLRAVLMAGAYLAMVALMGIGIGAITRHTASAIGVFVGITYVLPALLAGTTGTGVAKFFPTMIAGNSLAVTVPVDSMLTPWAGCAVLCLYTAALLAVGGRLLVRRDA